MIKLARGAGAGGRCRALRQKIRIGRRNAAPARLRKLLATLVRANRAIGDDCFRGRIDVSRFAFRRESGRAMGGAVNSFGANARGRS